MASRGCKGLKEISTIETEWSDTAAERNIYMGLKGN